MSKRLAFLVLPFAACLNGCSDQGGDVPNASPAVVTQLFKTLIPVCSAPLRDEAAIDQTAVAAAGWRVSRRTVYSISSHEEETHAADAYPALKADDWETTEWTLPGSSIRLYLDREGVNDELPRYGKCHAHADVGDRKEADAVVAGVQAHFGRPPDRVGEISMGGDSAGLIPRRDVETRGYYWQLAKHDVYVITDRDGLAKLEVVAMPDRSKLDQYSDNRPEIRLYTPEESRQDSAGAR